MCVRAPVRVCSCRQEWMTTAFLKLYAAIYSPDFLEEGEKGEGSFLFSLMSHVNEKITTDIPTLLHQ